MKLMLVAIGGAFGSTLRYLISQWIGSASGNFPWNTFAINCLGCLLIGFFAVKFTDSGQDLNRLLIMTGILGGFTTFSAFSLELVQLIFLDKIVTAALYALSSCLFGLFFCGVGYLVAQKFL